MEKFNLAIFICKIGRLPVEDVRDLLEKHEKDLVKLPMVEVNQLFNYFENKLNLVSNWRKSKGMEDILVFRMIATKIPELTRSTFEEIDNINKLHPMIQIEVAHSLRENERVNLLNNFGNRFTPLVVQNFILALGDENQKRMMIKYKEKILECESNLLTTFVGALSPSMQKYFLQVLKTSKNKLDAEAISSIVYGLYDENIEYFFTEFHDNIQNLDEKQFVEVLSLLNGTGLLLFNKHFESRIKDIPAEVLLVKLGMNIDDPEQMYNVWLSNKAKMNELSTAYFYLTISRFTDELRVKSLDDFKEKYNALSADELLDLFEFDADEMKAKLFTNFKDKLCELTSERFIDYVNDKIENAALRSKIFLLYKDYLCQQSDEDFIYFIETFSERSLRHSWDRKEASKELSDYVISNFKDRLKAITTEFIPSLFDKSATCLQHEYIILLKENIEKLICEKTYVRDLLRSVWGESKTELITAYQEQFKTLNAGDWYSLLKVIDAKDYSVVEEFLLTCDIDNFDFINVEQLLSDNKAKRMFYCFEKNLEGKMVEKYTILAENGKTDELLDIYNDLTTKVIDEYPENVLVNYNCINLLFLLRVLLKYNIINNQDDYYLMFKEMFMNQLLAGLEKEDPENINLIKDSVFYRLVKGSINPTMLLSLTTLKGLIFFNRNVVGLNNGDNINIYRPSEIEHFVDNVTEEQVIKLNYRLFKQLCKKLYDDYKEDYPDRDSIRNLAIRLYLAVGFSNAKKLVDLKVPLTRYEYIFNGIEIKSIRLNDSGEPIINKKLNDFMFGSSMEENSNIVRLLEDKIPEFEKRFAEIYNKWDEIYENLNGNVTVARVLKWFEDYKILLDPDEYRLLPIFKELGSREVVLQAARRLYSDMRKREYSAIPKVVGNYNDEYTYEMLDLDDPLGLAVGYITRCCFLIDGMSRSSLYHSAQSKEGRIFIVRKQGELIAQSWVWRNGNLLCFDNVETRGHYDWDILLETYKKAAQNILDISVKEESTKEQIKLVTVGISESKMSLPNQQIKGKDVKLPRVDDYIYTDARYGQAILATTGDKELYYGEVKAEYRDKRKTPGRYKNIMALSSEVKTSIVKRIRAIDFIKNHCTRPIDFNDYQYIAVTDDWYILLTNQGKVECVLLDSDSRARVEIYDEIDKLDDIFTKMGIREDSKQVSGQVLSFVKGSE